MIFGFRVGKFVCWFVFLLEKGVWNLKTHSVFRRDKGDVCYCSHPKAWVMSVPGVGGTLALFGC